MFSDGGCDRAILASSHAVLVGAKGDMRDMSSGVEGHSQTAKTETIKTEGCEKIRKWMRRELGGRKKKEGGGSEVRVG